MYSHTFTLSRITFLTEHYRIWCISSVAQHLPWSILNVNLIKWCIIKGSGVPKAFYIPRFVYPQGPLAHPLFYGTAPFGTRRRRSGNLPQSASANLMPRFLVLARESHKKININSPAIETGTSIKDFRPPKSAHQIYRLKRVVFLRTFR